MSSFFPLASSLHCQKRAEPSRASGPPLCPHPVDCQSELKGSVTPRSLRRWHIRKPESRADVRLCPLIPVAMFIFVALQDIISPVQYQ